MTDHDLAGRILESRRVLAVDCPPASSLQPTAMEAEGGCGVIGIACSDRIAGRHLLQALTQMRNRGNGKGGGIAAVGLDAGQMGVTEALLLQDYLLAVAYLDPEVRAQVERTHIYPTFDVDHVREVPHMPDYGALDGLDVAPPDVVQYFVRVKPEVAGAFASEHGLANMTPAQLADEIVYQNTYRLNQTFYAATGATRAFVMSHGKNMMVLKMVGYGDDVVRYYRLEDVHAHVWIGHHRYPTKGRVWHPGGAHPFIGMNEALVHNGDFANYASISEYLAQRHIHPLFLTDTEVSVQVFDLLHRTYGYPLEYVIEALAPTTERDFAQLPATKQRIYRLLQNTHMHCSPDGPWFFLVAQSDTGHASTLNPIPTPAYRLIGITDTSMLRPQVFAIQHGHGATVGMAASEQQGIDAALGSLAAEDHRFWARADRTWNARGGSHTDGGAFIFTVSPDAGKAHGGPNGEGGPGMKLVCTDKFGRNVAVENPDKVAYVSGGLVAESLGTVHLNGGNGATPNGNGHKDHNGHNGLNSHNSHNGPNGAHKLYEGVRLDAASLLDPQSLRRSLPDWTYGQVEAYLAALEALAGSDVDRAEVVRTLTWLTDRRYPTGSLRRSCLIALFEASLGRIFAAIRDRQSDAYQYVDTQTDPLPHPATPDSTVIVDARDYPIEGPHSLALAAVHLRDLGWRHIIVAHAQGHRFIGNGLGPVRNGNGSGHENGNGHGGAHLNGPQLRIDVYGSSGDYLASGIDNADIVVHGNAQDQLAQIMKGGRLVVYGDVGQTFMYAAKGGRAFVMGNAAGRPLINAVGGPRVVINGTCLDYLAESFMAGDPHAGGGFVILNGIAFDDDGRILDLDTPYPGGNLFSLASGGCLFVRDPGRCLSEDQLNGGEFAPFTEADWALIEPYLKENEALFGIPVARLLQVAGHSRPAGDVYRKIQPRAVRELQAEEAWVTKHE